MSNSKRKQLTLNLGNYHDQWLTVSNELGVKPATLAAAVIKAALDEHLQQQQYVSKSLKRAFAELEEARTANMELPVNAHTLYSTEHNIRMMLPDTDIVVGSVLVPGDKAPHLITKDMLKIMQPGTVLVDVAIDQGGCFETSRPTTHSEPVYTVDGIVHYAVANIPGAVPNTSTTALTNATLRYAIALADKGWKKACKDDPALYRGLNIVNGKVTFKAVADVFGLEYEPVEL